MPLLAPVTITTSSIRTCLVSLPCAAKCRAHVQYSACGCSPWESSLFAEANALDHGAPPYQLTAHEAVELRQCHRGRLVPDTHEKVPRGRRARNNLGHRGIPALDDRPRRLCRCKQDDQC